MSPLHSNVFPKLKEPMCGRRFSSLEELPTDGARAIRHMNESGVWDGIIMLPERWDSFMEKQGDYIEGNKGVSKKLSCALVLKLPPYVGILNIALSSCVLYDCLFFNFFPDFLR